MIKVLKFGGTSMANAQSIQQVKDIILSCESNRFVIVSAPGKRLASDTKVTDLLLSCKDNPSNLSAVINRFEDIIAGLNLKIDLEKEFGTIKENIEKGASIEYLASRGEYLSAIVSANYLGFEFIDAADIILFSESGKFLSEETNRLVKKRLFSNFQCNQARFQRRAIIPGFYGATKTGEIKTFSRGGSDVTGAIIARAVNAAVYENYTDVNGVMSADPRVVEGPNLIDILTYKELRELSYMGASVLHSDSIFPVRKADIPINVKNTFNRQHSGTLIVPTKHYLLGKYKRDEKVVTGIAGKKGFIAVYLEKSMMNDELGFARKVLSVFERNNISIEQMPSGIDTLTVIFCCSQMEKEKLDKVKTQLQKSCQPDSLEIAPNISLIAIVGHGMNQKKGTAAKVCKALSDAGINIRLINQGSSELNIIVGVEDKDYERAIKALYAAFY